MLGTLTISSVVAKKKLREKVDGLPKGEKWILTMDRTNWKFGKANINFLVLGVAYKGMAIPLFWYLLDKRGNSNYSERILIKLIGKPLVRLVRLEKALP